MEPRIQYATASDGTSIAFWSLGDGLPVVIPPPAMPWSHIELEWQIPEWRHWYEHLADRARLVRYDGRGSGLSERAGVVYSPEGFDLDLAAVVDRLGLERFALFGCFSAGSVAIRYAAHHPERVSHLMLWCAYPGPAENKRMPQLGEVMDRLIDVDYETFTETLAHTVFGWSAGEAAHRLAVYMQQSLEPEAARHCMQTNELVDVEDLVPLIKAPTLVMHRRALPILDVDVARRLASRIPDARLQIMEGSSLSPYLEGMETTIRVMDEFLGTTPQPAAAAAPHRHPGASVRHEPAAGFRTIMFTDMEGSTSLTQRLGDAEAQTRVRQHDAIVRRALDTHDGTEVKHTGDGIMASFTTASAAVECAIAIQRAFAYHNTANPAGVIAVRIGLNAGEPVAEGDDLFGTAVQLASRVCNRAAPSEILTSDVVRQLVAGKGFLFADRGEAELRGFEDPVRVYEVRWREDGSSS